MNIAALVDESGLPQVAVSSASSASSAPGASGAPRVLLVVEDAARRQALRQVLRSVEPDCRVESDADSIDALLSAARMHADLVLVDASLAMGAAAALTRHLARVAPQATVMVFDTPAAPRALPGALHWTDAPAACTQWLAAHRAQRRQALPHAGWGGRG